MQSFTKDLDLIRLYLFILIINTCIKLFVNNVMKQWQLFNQEEIWHQDWKEDDGHLIKINCLELGVITKRNLWF